MTLTYSLSCRHFSTRRLYSTDNTTALADLLQIETAVLKESLCLRTACWSSKLLLYSTWLFLSQPKIFQKVGEQLSTISTFPSRSLDSHTKYSGHLRGPLRYKYGIDALFVICNVKVNRLNIP